MKKIFLFLFLVVSVFAVSAKGNNKLAKSQQVTVEINFGDQKEAKMVSIDWSENMSALEALQKSSSVETHPVGPLVFVTSIDQVAGERGKMAWYYKVNGKPADKLAIDKMLKPGDTMSWRFVKDVCSCTVDKK